LQHSLGIAFIFVTHDQEEALTMSDRIVVMRAGKIEQIGTPRDIYRHPKNRFVAEFIGETNLFQVTVDRIAGPEAFTRTADGIELRLPAVGRKIGETITAILRPTDFTLADAGIPGTVVRAVYLGSDLYLFVRPQAGGPEIRIVVRDGAGFEEGAAVHLAHDPARVHVLEGA
jgi:spermidine/putrescine transport system ATP-binding protein